MNLVGQSEGGLFRFYQQEVPEGTTLEQAQPYFDELISQLASNPETSAAEYRLTYGDVALYKELRLTIVVAAVKAMGYNIP